MLIYLLRHGQTEYNAQKRYQGQRDIPLSPEGAAQLRRADFDPDVVYVSTLQRTSQTARILFPEAKLVPVDVPTKPLPVSINQKFFCTKKPLPTLKSLILKCQIPSRFLRNLKN